MNGEVIIKNLGIADYTSTLLAMQNFTDTRTADTPDEFWILEHPPVFTLGLAGRTEHILEVEDILEAEDLETANILKVEHLKTVHNIPIIHCDRGGQVTYHAPGQIIIYMLIDLKRAKLSIRDLVTNIENGVIDFLASLGIKANGDRSAPGVYVDNKKIASLGLKVRKGCTYHGLSFNINMDLTPFNYINVCGYKGLQVTQLYDIIKNLHAESYINLSPMQACPLQASPMQAFTVQAVAPLLTDFLLQAIYK
jgi:lipoyl(octanoyl) transferase